MQFADKKLKVGVIGLGHQSMKEYIPAIKVLQNIELVGVVEVDKQKLENFLKENKKC